MSSDDTIVLDKQPKRYDKPLPAYLLHWFGLLYAFWWLPTPTIIPGGMGSTVLLAYTAISIGVLVCNSLVYRRQSRSLLLPLAGLGAAGFVLNLVFGVELRYFSGMVILDMISLLGSYASVAVVVLSLYLYANHASVYRGDNPSIAGFQKLKEWGSAIFVAGVLALLIRGYVVQAFKIPSGSMLQTLKIGDQLLVNKFIYGMPLPFTCERVFKVRDPQREDVIVFLFPGDRSDDSIPYALKRDFIKRIIGLPGDEVALRDKKVYINGELFEIDQEIVSRNFYSSDYCADIGSVSREASSRVAICMNPVTVPADSYFVLGDNRDNSKDSRFWGFVNKSDIKGLAFIKYWSWDHLKREVRWKRLFRPID